jgi:hypothetical protein
MRCASEATTGCSRSFKKLAVPDGQISPADQGNKNSLFVIPLLTRGFFRTDGTLGTSGLSESQTAVGPISGYISRGTDDFALLKNFQDIWQGTQLTNGVQADFPSNQFPPHPYQDDNYLVKPALIDPLSAF